MMLEAYVRTTGGSGTMNRQSELSKNKKNKHVPNIEGLHRHAAKIKGIEISSLWQRLNSFEIVTCKL